VLMYVGTYDWICNFVGNERFLDALEWDGAYGYRHASRYLQRKWIGGETWEFENLRYARVHGAGHMVSLIVAYCSSFKLCCTLLVMAV